VARFAEANAADGRTGGAIADRLGGRDPGIHKFFRFTEQVRFQFRAEMFNAFNHANFAAPNTLANSPNFGFVSASRAPRLIQLGGRILF
jgi:hypothetical protein